MIKTSKALSKGIMDNPEISVFAADNVYRTTGEYTPVHNGDIMGFGYDPLTDEQLPEAWEEWKRDQLILNQKRATGISVLYMPNHDEFARRMTEGY